MINAYEVWNQERLEARLIYFNVSCFHLLGLKRSVWFCFLSFLLIFNGIRWNWKQACWYMRFAVDSFHHRSMEIMKSLVQVQCDLHFNKFRLIGTRACMHACVPFSTLFNAKLFCIVSFFALLFGLHVLGKFAVAISILCINFGGWIAWQ